MKNFTNNFKQFTSRLSARWLIMALMLLLGTSSAWGVTIYFDNTNTKWSNVYIYLYNGTYWDYDNGSGANNIKACGTMTPIGNNIYSYTYSGNYNQVVSFTSQNQCGYNNFSGNSVKVCYSDSRSGDGSAKYTNSKPLFIPDTSSSFNKNNNTATYYHGDWATEPQIDIDPCTQKYYLKHAGWSGSDWAWKELTNCNDGVYTLEATYNGSGCNYNTSANDNGAGWIANLNNPNNIQSGTLCIFTFDPSGPSPSITITPKCTTADFSVNSLSNLAVGCTATASITGDNVTVTWSSSETSVASIDPNTGVITAETAGETTITATTTDADGFCAGVVKETTLTVNSPSVLVEANKTSLCAGEELILIATVTNAGTGNTYQWYKGDNSISGATSATYTINSVSTDDAATYKVAVSGGILCQAKESAGVTVAVNALPNAPSLTSPAPVCEGTPFTLPEKDNNKKTITWVGVDNRTLTGLTAGTHKYTAKIVENGCESTTVDYTITVKEQLAKPVLEITNVKQCGSNYTAGKIVISNHNLNNTYILKKDGNPINKAYNNGYSLSENEIGTYTVDVSKDNACGATSDDVTIEVINNTPTVTPFEITKQANVCMGNPVTLSYDDTEQSGDITYAWYKVGSEEVLGREKILTIQESENASYKLVVTVTSNDCPASDEATTTVEPKAVPSAPTFDEYEMDVCVNQQFTLPTPNNLKYEEEPLWTVDGLPTTAIQTINVDGEYTYTAYKNDGCPSQGTPFTVRVNPEPTINIGEDVTAVKFEDVVLTATGENIDKVEWTVNKGTITEDAIDPKKAILTYDQTGEVIVTATATSAASCTSVAATKTVTFDEEGNCEPTITTHTTKTKIRAKMKQGQTSWNVFKIYSYGVTDSDSNGWPGAEMDLGIGEDEGYYVYTFENVTADFNIILNNGNSGGENQTVSGAAKAGKIYTFEVGAKNCSQDNDTRRCLESSNVDYTTTSDPELSAPAVKTVSATSEEGSGVVNFTGKIIKTGCADNSKIYYGYQYRLETDDWPTTGVQAGNDKLQLKSLTNASETALHYEFSSGDITLDNGKYVFRAYIINGYEFTNGNYDQGVYYGIDIPVTVSTKKYPIENLQIQYANEKGVVLQDQNVTYCVGDDAYIKLIYDGSRLKPEEDEINISSTLENTFTLVEGIADLYTFVVKGNETITVNAKNEENTNQGIEPATNSIDISTYVQPQTPSITLPEEMAVVCSNGDGATITVNEPQEGITYSLYIDGVAEAAQTKTPAEGTLQFTGIKTAGTYYVTAVNPSCSNNIAKSLDSKSIEVIDASANTIAIEPDEDTTNPWVPVKLKVTKNSVYDYTLVCKQDETDVTESVVINKKDDIYTIKFPKPGGAKIDGNGQVVFDNIEYIVTVSLDSNVKCGTTSASSRIILTKLTEDCN